VIISTATVAPFGLKAILVIAALFVIVGLYAVWITRDKSNSKK